VPQDKTVAELEAEIKQLEAKFKATPNERTGRFIQQNITARKAQLARLKNPNDTGMPPFKKIAKVGN
jgi:hypothetical protein